MFQLSQQTNSHIYVYNCIQSIIMLSLQNNKYYISVLYVVDVMLKI